MKKSLLFFLYSLITKGVCGELIFVSMTEGDSVTLHTGLAETQIKEAIEWRFGAELDRIARIKQNSDPTIYDNVLNEKFRGRLQLNGQTGDLTVRNIKATDSGVYEVSNSINTFKKSFIVTVEVGENQLVSVLLGDSVTLQTDAVDIQKYNMIWWRFKHGKSPVAEINRTARNISTSDGPDGIFRHRLLLDYLTGSLTIKNTGTKHSGLYEVDISSSSKHTIHRSFSLTVSGETESVLAMEGESITLKTNTDIQIYDLVLWMLQDIIIAEIHEAAQRIYLNNADEQFRGRLQLDNKTRSLIITNVRKKDSGIYELKICSSRHTIHKKITVTVNVVTAGQSSGIIIITVVLVVAFAAAVGGMIYYRQRFSEQEKRMVSTVLLMEGGSFTLNTGCKIQKNDQVIWMFGDEDRPIAQIEGEKKDINIYSGPDQKFKDKLTLDQQTGDLTIKTTTTAHTGQYKLKIFGSGKTLIRLFSITVTGGVKTLLAMKRDTVTLSTDLTEIQIDDVIEWKFGPQEIVMAQIRRGNEEISPILKASWRYKDRLKLDQKTGSLIITNTRTTDSGLYKVELIRSGNVSLKLFSVTVSEYNMRRRTKSWDPENMPLMIMDTSNSAV